MRPSRRFATLIAIAGTLIPAIATVQADVTGELAAVQTAHATARDVQRQIDALSGALRGPSQTLEDRQIAGRVRGVEQDIQQVHERILETEGRIRALQESESGLVPLLHSMLDLLERSIELDLPFDLARRKQAVADARRALSRHELSLADRFGRVLNAYLAEVRHGYTSEFASREITVDGDPRLVQLLRIGRLALYFVTADGHECGLWLPTPQRFAPLAKTDCAILADAATDGEHADLLTLLPLPGQAP